MNQNPIGLPNEKSAEDIFSSSTTWGRSTVTSRGAVRSAAISYAAVRIVAGSRPVLVIV